MPDKLTDSEIKKALEYCSNPNNTCDKCILFNAKDDSCQCASNLRLQALDLINRLQAENERLKKIVGFTPARGSAKSPFLNMVLDNVRAEAYKECIEKVKEIDCSFYVEEYYLNGEMYSRFRTDVFNSRLDNLLKELVGDN